MPHVAGLVCFGDEPAHVPDALVDAIRHRVAEFAATGFDPCRGLKHGDRVRIQGGPFESYEAVFDTRLSGKDRVRVLLELLSGKSVALDLHAGQLERVSGVSDRMRARV
jgi:transcriptional antiterminator RfaH